jgi:glycolate oxidase
MRWTTDHLGDGVWARRRRCEQRATWTRWRSSAAGRRRVARPTAALVRWARAHEVPVTVRGAGTGLAGGATPAHGGIVLSVNRMDRLLRVDPERMLAWVEPGLVNLSLSQQVASHGLYYAPDPASQQVSTVGGNVATNAGGPHCSKYGVTLNHVLAIAVLDDGSAVAARRRGARLA